jgi:hypothetical protein
MNSERDGQGFHGGFDAAADQYATAREAKVESQLREIDEGRVVLIPWVVVRQELLVGIDEFDAA